MQDPFKRASVYLVRHGATTYDTENRLIGWANPPLDEDGIAASEQLANFFSYESIGQVISSDLLRAVQTAEYILSIAKVPHLQRLGNARDWGIGDLTGKVKDEETLHTLNHFIYHPDEVPPGDKAESYNQFLSRWNEFLQSVLATANPMFPTVIVCHAPCIGAVLASLDACDSVGPGGVVAIYINEDGSKDYEVRLGGSSC